MSQRTGLRIALLNPVFWPEVRRGSERFVRDLADELLARGHHPTLITSHRRPFPSRTLEDGLPVIRVPRAPDRRLNRRMFEAHLTHVPFSYLALRRGDFELAHALYPTDALAAIRWSRHTGRPSVLSLMGVPHRRGLANRRLRPEIFSAALGGADATVALSRAAADGCHQWLGVRPEVINPGVDLRPSGFTPGGTRNRRPTIICPAALGVERKRIRLLLDAFSLMRREHPEARLLLSRPSARGEGGTDEARARATAGVELVDLDERPSLVDALRESWLCALPSLGEAFGLVLAEALACGTPVLGSDDAGLRELAGDPNTGVLFSGSDPSDLAQALERGLALTARAGISGACRAQAELFSAQRTADRYLELYGRLTSRNRPAISVRQDDR